MSTTTERARDAAATAAAETDADGRWRRPRPSLAELRPDGILALVVALGGVIMVLLYASVGFFDERSGRDEDEGVLAAGAGLERPLSAPAVFSLPVPVPHEIRQAAEVSLGLDDDVPPLAAVPPVRPAVRYVLLPPEAERAVAASA